MSLTHPRYTWIYQARRVATQGNAAGGAIVIDIAVAQPARLISCLGFNSGSNTVSIDIVDEDNALTCRLGSVGAAPGTICSVPRTYTSSLSSPQITSVGVFIAPGQKLSCYQSNAGAQNDTLTVALVLELFNSPEEPTWSKDRSTNATDVTLAANTISTSITRGRWLG